MTLARACLDVGIAVELYEKRTLNEMLSGPGGIFIQRNALRVYKLLWEGRIWDHFYRDDIYDRAPLGREWGRGRVTLIGDAAHPVQPNIGQGGCMAIEDAFELVKQLSTSAKEDFVPSLLRQFEVSRCDRVARVYTTARQVGQLGQAEGAIACFIRNWIYKLTPTKLADQQFKWLFDYVPNWDKATEE